MNSEVPSNPEQNTPIDLNNNDREDLWENKPIPINLEPIAKPNESVTSDMGTDDRSLTQQPERKIKAEIESEIQPETEPETPTVHQWLEEIDNKKTTKVENREIQDLQAELDALKQEKQTLIAEIQDLKDDRDTLKTQQIAEIEASLGGFLVNRLKELEEKKNVLTIAVEKLERRRDRIEKEMSTTFAGTSQDIAIRIQGFKDYLVGSLQDLAASAEQLQLSTQPATPPPVNYPPERSETRVRQPRGERNDNPPPSANNPQFGDNRFQEQSKIVRSLLEQYRNKPDYYGPPWQLRRTFEPVHAEKVRNWFFSQGGRGAIRSMGGRLQNILIASAAISILYRLYGDRTRALILANSPERLGEWRRGLQDCLGISRSDYGSSRGVALFEASEALVQKADRLVEEKLIPLIVIDETEEQIDLSLLQYPLWLAFAPDPKQVSGYMY
jgi:cell division protein FtsB